MRDSNLTDSFKDAQEPRKYLTKMLGKTHHTLPELVKMSTLFLERHFRVTGLNMTEGVVLKECVESAAECCERDLEGG